MKFPLIYYIGNDDPPTHTIRVYASIIQGKGILPTFYQKKSFRAFWVNILYLDLPGRGGHTGVPAKKRIGGAEVPGDVPSNDASD